MFNNLWSNNLRQNRSTFPPNVDRVAERFTDGERYVIEMYFSQYNEHLRQIDERYYELNLIRNNIHRILLGTFSSNQSNQSSNPPNHDLFEPIPRNTTSRNSRVNQRYTRTSAPSNTFANANSNVNTTGATRARTDVDNLIRSFFDTIPVRPTPTQITRATNITSYSNISNPLNTRCPISLEQFAPTDSVTQLVRCGHIFNSIDFAQWFQYNVRCPVCRQDIRENYTTSIGANSNANANVTNANASVRTNTRSDYESMSHSSSFEDETKEENTFQESKQNDDDDEDENEDNSANIIATPSVSTNNHSLANSNSNYTDLIALIFDYTSDTSESLPISTIDPSGNTVMFEALFRTNRN